MDSKQDQKIDKGLKLLAKSSVIVFIGLFLSKVFTYVYKIIIARYYGPEVYGLFVLGIMILSATVAFASFGFSEGLVRYISFYRGKKGENKIRFLYRTSLLILTISGILAGVILFLFSDFISITFFHNAGLIIFLKIFSFLIPIFIFANVFLAFLRAYEKISEFSFVFNILQNVMKVVFLGLLIFLGWTTKAIAFSYFLGIFSMFVVSYFLCRYKLPQIFLKYKLSKEEKKKIRKEFISYSWPILFLGVITLVFSWIDSFSIAYFMDVASVGFYNAAFPIAALMGIAPELFRQLFLPLITKEYSKGNSEVIKELSKQSAKWIFIINIPLFIILFLFPGAVINILFGPEFISAAMALRILCISGIFASFNLLLVNLILMTGKSKIILINLLVFSVLNIILNIVLVPIFGINGAAASTTLVNIGLAFVLFIEVKSYVSIVPLRRKMLRILLISIIPTALLLILRKFISINFLSLTLLGIFFILLYFVLIFLTKAFDKNDLMVMKAFWKKIF